MEQLRVCKKCNIVKSINKFSLNYNGNDNSHKHMCIMCVNRKNREYARLRYYKNRKYLLNYANERYREKVKLLETIKEK